MRHTVIPAERAARLPVRMSALGHLGRRLVLQALSRMTIGRVEIHDQGDVRAGGTDGREGRVRVEVLDPAFYGAVAFGGSVGAGEAYMDGMWTCDDLPRLIELMTLNEDAAVSLDSLGARFAGLISRFAHRLRRNTRAGSGRNIRAHYDLGDEFFSLFLDRTMMYSCAVFDDPSWSLEQAQREKMDRACRRLDLSPRDHLLEIGAGWGGLALHAAREYGCRVTTTTISERQYAAATSRVRGAVLEGRVTVLKQDYRDLTGVFDKLVSIEMIEAVGADHLDTYFAKCSSLLRPEGMMLLQAITMRDQRYADAVRRVDFLKKHIFPGSFLPSISAMTDSIRRTTDMGVYHLEDIGAHYVTTLQHWRAAYLERLDAVRAMGYPETFVRMWDFYLAYCEGVFRSRRTSDVQMLLTKPRCRRAPLGAIIPGRHPTATSGHPESEVVIVGHGSLAGAAG